MCACVIVVESKLVYVSPANDLSTLYSSSYLLSFALSCISFWRRFVCVCSTLAAFPPPLSLSTALSSHLLRRHILLSFLVFGRLSFMDLMRVCRWYLKYIYTHWSHTCLQSVRLSRDSAWPWHCWCACKQKIEEKKTEKESVGRGSWVCIDRRMAMYANHIAFTQRLRIDVSIFVLHFFRLLEQAAKHPLNKPEELNKR